jgi:hypothetical protein
MRTVVMTDAELIGRLRSMVDRGTASDEGTLHAALVRLDELTRAAPRRTVPVRIAVALGSGGAWAAWGESGRRDRDMCDEALGQVGDDVKACYIVTADIPVPETREISGSVKPMSGD